MSPEQQARFAEIWDGFEVATGAGMVAQALMANAQAANMPASRWMQALVLALASQAAGFEEVTAKLDPARMPETLRDSLTTTTQAVELLRMAADTFEAAVKRLTQ